MLVVEKEDIFSKIDKNDFEKHFPKKSLVRQIHRLQVLNLERNTFRQQPAMIVYTSGTTGRPKVKTKFQFFKCSCTCISP